MTRRKRSVLAVGLLAAVPLVALAWLEFADVQWWRTRHITHGSYDRIKLGVTTQEELEAMLGIHPGDYGADYGGFEVKEEEQVELIEKADLDPALYSEWLAEDIGIVTVGDRHRKIAAKYFVSVRRNQPPPPSLWVRFRRWIGL